MEFRVWDIRGSYDTYSIYLRGTRTCSTKPDYCPPAPCQADQRMAQLFRYDMKGLSAHVILASVFERVEEEV